jgi:hypothetical protein
MPRSNVDGRPSLLGQEKRIGHANVHVIANCRYFALKLGRPGRTRDAKPLQQTMPATAHQQLVLCPDL